MARLALILATVALVVALFPLFGTGHEAGPEQAPAPEVAELEVAVYMGRMQRYHQKLWAASRAGNAELAGFYLHELEEAMAEIAEAGLVDEGVPISEPMRTYGLVVVEALERTLETQGVEALHASADMLVNACNSCHSITGHSFIVIQEPVDPQFPDQNFVPQVR